MTTLHRFRKCRSGAAAIEFAVVSLVLALMAFAVVDFGRGLHTRNRISYAADIASRRLLTNPATSDSVLDSVVRTAFAGPNAAALQIAVVGETIGDVGYRTLTVAFPLALRIPGLTATVITLRVARRIPAL